MLIAWFSECFGQAARRDSLLALLGKAPPDTNKVLLYLSVSEVYESSAPDTARYYIRLGRELSKELGYTKGIQRSYRFTSYTHAIQSRYDSVLYYNQLGLELARQVKDTFSIGVSLSNIGIAYRFMSDYEKAVEYSLEGAKLLEGKGYTAIESPLYDALQVLYMSLAQY